LLVELPRDFQATGITLAADLTLAVELANDLFGSEHANLQPHSASSANQSVLLGLLEPGDAILGMELRDGGHLTHGASVSFSGKYLKSYGYGLHNGLIDYERVRSAAITYRPKIIISGASSYPRQIDYRVFSEIASETGALLLADVSHTAGLIAANLVESPVQHADIVTMSTYKQLFGPRGGIILSNKLNEPNSKLSSRDLDRIVFPFSQGTPDIANIAAKAACLAHAGTAEFRKVMEATLLLARSMAQRFQENGIPLIGDGTDSHMILLDLTRSGVSGSYLEKQLESIGIYANRNLIPNDPKSPAITSGLRLGTNTIAFRGFTSSAAQELCDIVTNLILAGDQLSVDERSCLTNKVAELSDTFPISETHYHHKH